MIWQGLAVKSGLLIACVLILTQLMSSTSTSAQSESIGTADELVITGAYREAESMYRNLLKLDKTGDCYGGLAVSLTMQDKIAEADGVLKQAQENHLLDNVNVLAAGWCLCYSHANTSPGFREYFLFLTSSSALCITPIQFIAALPGKNSKLVTCMLRPNESLRTACPTPVRNL
jgi:hypothetical protein